MKIVYCLSFLFVAIPNIVLAKEFPVQARFFLGNTQVQPKKLNAALQSQSLEEMDMVNNFGIEATYKLLKYFDGGIRYTHRLNKMEEDPNNAGTDYFAELKQDSVLLMGRVPFFKTDIVRLDAFAGVGGSNTTLAIETASQNGELTKKESGDWFATPYAAAGGSISIGYKMVYLVLEAGFESNKVDDFKRSGNVTLDVEEIDLSGSYFTVGLMIDGMKASSK